MSFELTRCRCGRLSRRPCPEARCAAWARAHEKYLQLTFVPTEPLRRSAGKFVVGWGWERPR